MRWRGMLCALVVGSLGALALVPGPVGATGCGPGQEEGAGTEYDTDGDGLVCVNTETGEVTDDAGAQAAPGGMDHNQDGIVCNKITPSGSVVVTDNASSHEENSGCPPGFFPNPTG
ncbi:MAG: hypothetical protein M3340_11945 [Actinomycetota bacterium]|nr:hypothetical protein [Actinomycetota bacterium]